MQVVIVRLFSIQVLLVVFYTKLECEPMPNVMAAQSNIGGALCESSVIPFLIPRLIPRRKLVLGMEVGRKF